MSLLWAKDLLHIFLYVFLARFLRVRQGRYRSEPVAMSTTCLVGEQPGLEPETWVSALRLLTVLTP